MAAIPFHQIPFQQQQNERRHNPLEQSTAQIMGHRSEEQPSQQGQRKERSTAERPIPTSPQHGTAPESRSRRRRPTHRKAFAGRVFPR